VKKTDLLVFLTTTTCPSFAKHYFPMALALFGNEGPIELGLDLATGLFSFVLFLVTLYAWARRSKQPTLIFVSLGFLAFFVKQLVTALPFPPLHGELFGSVMDFLTLSLFFIALVVRPRRSISEKTQSKTEELDLANS
jgi:hypothetical protein